MTVTTNAFTFNCRSGPVVYGPEPLDDELSPTEVLVECSNAALNPVDLKLQLLNFFGSKQHTVRDFSGKVIKVGSKVPFAVGDAVCGCLCGKSSQFIGSISKLDTSIHAVFKKPQSLNFEHAAGLPLTFGTAFQMLDKANLKNGANVLILGGATSVGVFATQLAKKHYNARVTVTCSPRSEQYVKSFGADAAIDYHNPKLRDALKASASGAKYDAIIDTVGGYDAIAVIYDILKPASQGSHYVTINGDASPAQTYRGFLFDTVKTMPFVAFRLLFGKYYGINYHLFLLTNQGWPEVATKLVDQHHIEVPIDSEFPAAEIEKAWQKQDQKPRGKIILQF